MANAALPPPARLFLSYARADRDRVEPLADALRAAGHALWWDAHLEGGHRFATEIARELEAADAVIVCWSAESVRSHWVLDEATHGRDRGCLIPVRLDETPLPLGFRQLQAIDVAEGEERAAAAAVGRAAAHLRGEAVTRHDAETKSAPAKGRGAAKRERPVWVPFAWAAFGVLVWLLSYGMYN